MTASRPGKWTSARKAPKGTPMRAAGQPHDRDQRRIGGQHELERGNTSWHEKIRCLLDLSQIARLWSNLHLGSYLCMLDLLTTDEAATYLRLSQRKLYELLAIGAVPCTKVTGRWLFPRAALDRWVMAGLITSAALAQAAAPPIVGG